MILSGGTLSPGNSPGTITIGGDLSLLDGLLKLEIDPNGVSDFIVVGGNLMIGPDLLIDLDFLSAPTPGDTFNILSFFDVLASLDIDPAFDLNTNLSITGADPSSINVVLELPQSVSEPASLVLLLTALGGVRIMRRRAIARSSGC